MNKQSLVVVCCLSLILFLSLGFISAIECEFLTCPTDYCGLYTDVSPGCPILSCMVCTPGYSCLENVCVQLKEKKEKKENGATCFSDSECKSGNCGDILANQGDTRDITTNPESVCHENSSKCVIDSTGIEVNYGVKSCLTSKVFRTCYASPNKIGNSWGAQTLCASDDSCFEGRGCLKHEFIFRLSDDLFPAGKYPWHEITSELEDAMELSDSCMGVSFRINKIPPVEGDLDAFVNEIESKGYYYYITVGSSDFITWSGFPSYPGQTPFLLNISKICGYLKNEHAEGLYVHELMGETMYLVGDNQEEARRVFDWDSVEKVLACAKANKKKVLWNDFGWMGGWGNIRYAIDHDDKVRKIFETYGDVLVPLMANNVNTWDAWRNDGKTHRNLNGLQNDFAGGLSWGDMKYVSNKYTNGERGGSVQDWHWRAFPEFVLNVPASDVEEWVRLNYNGASDIEKYTRLNYDAGGKYTQFEDSNWNKNNPKNNGQFYIGIQGGKNYICGVSPCVSSDCDFGYTCESAHCNGFYDKKVNWRGDPFEWTANTYYGPRCDACSDAGRIGYAVEDLAWYQHTCVKNKFVWCLSARWSRGKTYVHNAYTSASCEGLSEPDCNSHSGCFWGSFLCV